MASANQVKAGIGRVNITPGIGFPFGMWMTQKKLLAEAIHRKILATALIIGKRDDNVIILSLDLLVLSERVVTAIKSEVSRQTGIDINRIWVTVTHTHVGPTSYEEYNDEGATRVLDYLSRLPKFCAEAAMAALGSQRPVRISAGVGRSRIGINRDLLTESGRYIIGPNENGAIDEDVGVLRIDNSDGSPYGCIFSYGCHPTVLGPDNTAMSPDYPGVARDVVEDLTGSIALFLQGAAGNVGPREQFIDSIDKLESLGRALGCEASKVFFECGFIKEYELDHIIESGAPLGIMREVVDEEENNNFHYISKPIQLEIGNPCENVIFSAEKILEDAEDDLEIAVASGRLEEAQRFKQVVARREYVSSRAARFMQHDTYNVSLAGFAIGSVALICGGMEPYAEISREIKQASPFRTTIFAAYEGRDLTYVVPDKYYVENPPMQVRNSPFAPGSAAKYVHDAIALLAELKRLQAG